MVLVGGMDTDWKPGGGRMSEKSSLLSDNAASSSSEDRSTTDGCKEVVCGGHMRTHSIWGLFLVSISIGPFAEFGEGGSLRLVVLSLQLRRK